MSYLVLARKYRPSNFDEVIGQSHITDLLKNVITSDRVAHAYLFCGPRGIGKTSCARILAKSLNCQEGPTLTPCGKCFACQEISQGTSFDVLEIDGASNRGIDEIRTLRENVKFAPSYGRYKIYIVDEVHMLTTEAFNALLKTLEEPPPHAKFVFATTDPNKVPSTIISRCQRYDFKRISLKVTVSSLELISKKESFTIDQDALYAIAKASQGSFRDALSILDQVSALGEKSITGDDVYSMLGLVERDFLFELVDALAQKNCSDTLKVLDKIIDRGKDIKQLSRDLVEHLRNLMVIKVGGKSLGRLIDYPIPIKEAYLNQSQNFTLPEILQCIDMCIEAQEVARITESLRIPLEIAFAKMTYQQDRASKQTASVAAVSKPTSATASASSLPAAQTGILKNEKGTVNIVVKDALSDESDSEEEDLDVKPIPGMENVSKELDLNKIKRSWDALTFAVSRIKMSLATYMQEGCPTSFDGKNLMIGFSKDHEFHKDSLDHSEHIKLVEDVFAKSLKTPIVIKYEIIDTKEIQQQEQEPLVKKALDEFNGKIVSQWHQE